MAKNEFKPFATASNANVTPQSDWEALPALLAGFSSGKASSAQVNKALRQASFIAAAIAQFVSNKTNSDILDDGDLAGFITKLTNGFAAQYLSRSNPLGDVRKDGTILAAKTNLDLQGFNTNPGSAPNLFSSMTSPNGKIDVFVTNDGQWGAQDNTTGQPAPLIISRGGTGATTAAGARTNLGLGSVAVENTVPVAKGGTGSTNIADARVAFGVQSIFSQSSPALGMYNSISSPDGLLEFVVANGGAWGLQNKLTGDISALTIGRGGTGAKNATDARTNLGLGTASTRNVGFNPGQVPDMSGFTTGPGWAKLPNGKILQWIQISTSTSAAVQSSFPIVFPSGPHMVCASATDVNNPNFVSAAVFNNVTFLVTAHNASGARVATNVFVYAIGE